MAWLNNTAVSEIATHTYLFINEIPQQSYQSTRQAGFPQIWVDIAPDYGMDPTVVNNPQYASRIEEALLSLPAFSIVVNIDDLFGPTGIYTHIRNSVPVW